MMETRDRLKKTLPHFCFGLDGLDGLLFLNLSSHYGTIPMALPLVLREFDTQQHLRLSTIGEWETNAFTLFLAATKRLYKAYKAGPWVHLWSVRDCCLIIKYKIWLLNSRQLCQED